MDRAGDGGERSRVERDSVGLFFGGRSGRSRGVLGLTLRSTRDSSI